MNKKRVKIKIWHIGQLRTINHDIIVPSQSQTLLDVLIENEVLISHSCGGNGTCGTCQIKLKSENSGLSDRSDLELEMSNDRGFLKEERLSCQSFVLDSIEIEIP